MMIASLLLLASTSSATGVNAFRGVNLDGMKWWGVRDTFISQAAPTVNYGRDWLLEGGPEKTIFLSFEGLAGLVPANMEIAEAELVLTKEFGDAEGAKVRSLAQPWIEGGGRRGLATLGYERPGPPRRELGATWQTPAQGGSGSWPAGGGFVGNGAQVGEPKVSGDQWVVSNLGQWAREAVANPFSNTLALRFPNPVVFTSSDAPVGRPRLQLTFRPISRIASEVVVLGFTKSPTGLQALVKNQGAVKSGALQVLTSTAWRAPETKSLGPIDPGQTVSVSVTPPTGSEPTLASTRVIVTGQGVSPTRNEATYHLQGVSVPVDESSNAIVERWNQVILPQSRTSFAPDGPKVRLNAMLTSGASPVSDSAIRDLLKLPNWKGVVIANYPYAGIDGPTDPFPGLAGGDARDETSYMPLLPLTADGRLDKTMREGGVEWTGLLSITDVALLEADGAWATLVPDVIAARVFDSSGSVVRNTAATLTANDQKSDVKLTAEGTVRIPQEWLQNPNSLVKIEVTGANAGQAVLKGWQTVDAAIRTSQRGVLIPVTLFGKGAAVDLSRDLAADRDWTTADGKPFAMGQSVAAGSFVEVDLGRDRNVSMVEITTDPKAVLSALSIVGRQTGQISSGGSVFYRSDSYEFTARSFGTPEGDRVTLRLQSKPQSLRYLRIEPTGGNLQVFQVRVYPPLAP